jgi:hypothetical protein
MNTAEAKQIANYIASAGYGVEVIGAKVVVRDPVRTNGKIDSFKEITVDTLAKAARFIEERS